MSSNFSFESDEDVETLPSPCAKEATSQEVLGRSLWALLLPSQSFQELVAEAQAKIQETARKVLGAVAEVKSFGSILQGTFAEGPQLACPTGN